MDSFATINATLERNLAWVRAADAKVPPIFAVDAAMFGLLGLRLPHLETMSPFIVVLWGLAAATLLGSLVCLGLVAFPRLAGPKDSVVFFGTAARMEETAYIQRLMTSPPSENLLHDIARQAFRNAEIAAEKYDYLRLAMIGLFASIPFWLGALITTRQL